MNVITGISITAVLFWIAASWLTHIIFCISASKLGFLVAGAIFFPIAVIHGTGCWFGLWGG